MGVRFVVDDDPVGENLADLADALRDDRRLVRHVRHGPPDPGAGQMGAADLLDVTLVPAVLTALAGVVGAWVTSRTQPTRLRVRRGETEIEIDSRKVKDPEQATRRLLDLLAAEATDDADPPVGA